MSINVFLIDPFACTITEETIEGKNLKDYYKLLSHETMPVDCFDVSYAFSGDVLADSDCLYVDDEGLLKSPERFVGFNGVDDIKFAGKVLVVGTDEEGASVSANTDIEKLRANIHFAGRDLIPTTTPWEAPK